MTKLSELTGQITTIRDQLVKTREEILGKIAALEISMADVDLPAETEAALDELRVTVQQLDDVVPDAMPHDPAEPSV